MSRARHAPREGRDMRRAAILLTALGVLATGLLLADGAPPTTASVPQGTEQRDRGEVDFAYCPVATGDGDQATVTVAAVGEEPSEGALLHHSGEGGREARGERTLEPGERRVTGLPDGEPVTVRARGGQVLAVWNVSGDRAATGPCVDAPSPEFYLTGLDTSLGSQATLHLFNPFTVDAVVRVRYGTPEGAADLVRTENVAVEAGRTASLDLTELQPEEPELGVVTETLTGRVVVQGEIERTHLDDEDEGPQGRALVPASTQLSNRAYFAYAVDGDAWSSRLAVFNPNDREAAVRVRTSDPDPETPVEEVSVPAGGVAGVDLAGRSESRSFAVVVESLNELPILVGRVEGGADEPSGIAGPTGAPRPATRWATAGPAGSRQDVLSAYNPGDEPVRVTATVAGSPVEAWEERTLEPGERQQLDLGDVDGGRWPALLESDGPLVAEVVSSREGTDDLARVVGLTEPAPVPDPVVTVPLVEMDQSLVTTPVVPSAEAGDG